MSFDTRLVQPKTIHIRPPANGHQQMRAFENPTVFSLNLNGTCFATHFFGQRVLGNLNVFGAQVLKYDLGHFGVVFAQRLHAFDDRDLRAQTPVRLRHLHANRATANDKQMLGLFAQFPKRFIGDVRHAVQSGDCRHKGGRAGRDHDAPRCDDMLTRLHFGGRDEFALFLNDPNAKAFEPLHAIHRLDLADHIGNVIFGSRVIYRWGDTGNPVL